MLIRSRFYSISHIATANNTNRVDSKRKSLSFCGDLLLFISLRLHHLGVSFYLQSTNRVVEFPLICFFSSLLIGFISLCDRNYYLLHYRMFQFPNPRNRIHICTKQMLPSHFVLIFIADVWVIVKFEHSIWKSSTPRQLPFE